MTSHLSPVLKTNTVHIRFYIMQMDPPVFIAAEFFTTARRWRQLKGPSADGWVNTCGASVYSGIPLGHKEEGKSDTCYSKDEP